jgi:hypothetical protein
MSLDEYIARLDAAFLEQKKQALRFIELYNESLPTDHCPDCQCSGHCPGLPCPECSYVHPVSWVILRGSEYGYEVVSLASREVVMAFSIEDGVD